MKGLRKAKITAEAWKGGRRKATPENMDLNDLFVSVDDMEEEQTFKVDDTLVRLWACPDHVQMTRRGAYRRVWPSAVRLAEYVLRRRALSTEEPQALRVLELGAGPGLTGLALNSSGTFVNVVLTDNDDGVLDLLRRNVDCIKENPPRVEYLSWGDTRAAEHLVGKDPFHLILGADVTFDRDAIPLLLLTASTALHTTQGLFLLALSYPRFADREEDIWNASKAIGLEGTVLEENDSGVRILALTHRGAGPNRTRWLLSPNEKNSHLQPSSAHQ